MGGSTIQQPLQSIPAAFRRYLPTLDGVRGVAILLVLIIHFFEPITITATSGPGSLAHAFVRSAWVGVDLFFVLSGFLITNILLHGRTRPGYFRNFYARRSLRIFPLYYGVLTITLLASPLIRRMHFAAFDDAIRNQGWLWLYLSNVAPLIRPNITLGNFGHFWSLAVEEHFYLVWPAVVYLATTGGARRWSLVMACGFGVLAAYLLRIQFVRSGMAEAAYSFTPCRMDALLIGGVAAVTTNSPGGRHHLYRIALLCGAVLTVYACLHWGLDRLDHLIQTIGYSMIAVAFAGGIVASAHAQRGQALYRCLTIRPLMVLGKYSYGIYVFHFPVLAVCRKFVAETTGHGLALPAFAFVATLSAAAFSYHIFEAPFLKLKTRFSSAAIDENAGVAQGVQPTASSMTA